MHGKSTGLEVKILDNKWILLPGTPDDDNRDYLPERIKGSDIVVNENGNNSQPYPEKLTEYHEDLLQDGQPGCWYEYIPENLRIRFPSHHKNTLYDGRSYRL